MQEVEGSVVIPNYNGMAYLDGVLSSLECQTFRDFEVILVDNGSADGSTSFAAASYPWVRVIELPDNYGFSRAVNEGIKASAAEYVLLLNNDTEVEIIDGINEGEVVVLDNLSRLRDGIKVQIDETEED